MHGQAEELARFTKRVGKVGSTKAWANRAGKDQARRLLQRAASKGEKFVGSESLARFKQRHGCSSSRSCSRSRSHSPKYCPHEALLARSAAATTRLAQRRSRATAAAAATAETTASTTTAAAHLELQNFWSGRPYGVTTVADFLEWQKSQGVTHTGRTMMGGGKWQVTDGKWELVKSSTASSPQEDEQPAAASRRSPSRSSRWSSNPHWSISPSRESKSPSLQR
jgi:hypothetical protein